MTGDGHADREGVAQPAPAGDGRAEHRQETRKGDRDRHPAARLHPLAQHRPGQDRGEERGERLQDQHIGDGRCRHRQHVKDEGETDQHGRRRRRPTRAHEVAKDTLAAPDREDQPQRHHMTGRAPEHHLPGVGLDAAHDDSTHAPAKRRADGKQIAGEAGRDRGHG
jgi:hypothetical protein